MDSPGIIEFNRLGKSQTVRVVFQTEEYLHFYITHGIKFGYELFSEWNVIVFSLGVVLNVKVLTLFKINVNLNVSNVPDVAVITFRLKTPHVKHQLNAPVMARLIVLFTALGVRF